MFFCTYLRYFMFVFEFFNSEESESDKVICIESRFESCVFRRKILDESDYLAI